MSVAERGSRVGKSSRENTGANGATRRKTVKTTHPVDDFIAGGSASITSKLILQRQDGVQKRTT
eukprot:3126601-Pyramimonas_sp.AAC.1